MAPAVAPIAATSSCSTEVEPTFSSQETVESGNSTVSEPSRVTDSNGTDGFIGRLVLPVYPAGIPQRSQSKLLQPMWKQMGKSCLVASRQDKATLTKPEEEGKREEAASTNGGQFGKEPHIRDLGTFWSWRPTDSEPLDCVYSKPDSEEYASTGKQTARRRNNCHNDGSAREQGEQRKGESRGQVGRQGGAAEEDLGRQGCGGHRDLGTVDSPGDFVQRTGSTSFDSQNTEPATTGRKTIRGFSQPPPRTRREMEEMEPMHSEEGDRARRPLHGTEESFVCKNQRAEGEAPWTTQRTTPCSSTTRYYQGGGTGPYRGHTHPLRRELRHYDQQQRRRGEEQHDSDTEPFTVQNPGGEPSQGSKDELKEARFEENVSIRIFTQQNTQNCYEFEATMRDIGSWDSKPWALYEGDFVTKSGHIFSKVCCPHSTLQHGGQEGDPLHHPVAGHSGEGGHSEVHAVQAYMNTVEDRNDKDDEGEDAIKDRQSLQNHELLCPGIIHLFGMNGAYLGQREDYQQRRNFEPDAIWEAIERVWGDELGAGTIYHVPQPQPSLPTDNDDFEHLYVIVDFLPLHDPLHQGRLAVLCDIKGWDGDELTMQRLEGAMLPEYATWINIVRDIGLQEACVHRVGNQCIIRLGMRLVLNDGPYVLADDDLISIGFDLLEEHVDRIILLQKEAVIRSVDRETSLPEDQHASEQTSSCQSNDGGQNRHPDDALDAAYRQVQRIRFNEDDDLMHEPEGQYAHLYHRTRDYVNALLDAGDPFEERRKIARIWNIEEQEILAIHPVLHPPEDLQGRVLITRWRRDNQFRVFDTDVQILIDVELHSGDNLQPAVQLFRHVEWSRNRMTRTDILAMTYVRDYCRLVAADACLVWINHQLWPIQDVALRQLRAGDFVRVAVPAQPQQTADALRALLQHAEHCARDHLYYYPHSDASSDGQEESEESTHTRYGHSPSQSEPEPLDKVLSGNHFEVDPETARNFENIIGGWGLACFTIDLFFLFGGAQGHLSFVTPAPFRWSYIQEALQSHFGCTKNLIHYHITFHPVIGGLERWSGRCRIVVEFSHIAVRPLHTRRVPALFCFSQSDSASNAEHFAWEAIYVPRPAESFDQWKQAAPLRIWHEGDLNDQSVPGMLLHGSCRTAPSDDPTLSNVLQEIGSANG